MQKEFEQKRKELLLEAENVVRMREEAYNQELLKLQTELEKHRRMQKKDSGASSTGDFFKESKNLKIIWQTIDKKHENSKVFFTMIF